MMHDDRRHRRSDEASQALFFQLDTSRERAQLEAMILADRDGLCVATANGSGLPLVTCEEIAAQMTVIGDGTPQVEGMVLASGSLWDVHVRRFEMAGYELYLCAVGGGGSNRAVEVDRSIGGVSRILAA